MEDRLFFSESDVVPALGGRMLFPMVRSKVRETIKKYHMVEPGDRILIAVSGGPDSVCLLNVIQAMAKDLGLTLRIAHLDHMFRGKDSAAEALFVANLAQKLNTPVTVEAIDVPAFCREHGLSPQEGARQVRYEFFQRVAASTGCTRIATGHTADDQAETFLMRLLRGAGASGLSAIPPVRGNIIRPLIEVTRDDVMSYVRSEHLEHVNDLSNTKPVYTRNRIRMEVLPLLKRFNPRIVETLAAEAALLRDEDEAVEFHLAAIAENTVMQEENDLSVKRDAFDILPPAFRRRLFRKILGMLGEDPSSLSHGQIDDALSFMTAAQTGRTMNLTCCLSISREYDRFIFSRQTSQSPLEHRLPIPGEAAIPELGLEMDVELREEPRAEPGGTNYRWQAEFDYAKIGSLLQLRNRRAGDWFCPAGMGGRRKKLQDYFVDEKVPLRKRDSVPLLCTGEHILWVVGLRTDERFLVGPETKKVVSVKVRYSNTRR
jgi:tRNA(Ile)-lysidine synthase